jgi:hypothetical protein
MVGDLSKQTNILEVVENGLTQQLSILGTMGKMSMQQPKFILDHNLNEPYVDDLFILSKSIDFINNVNLFLNNEFEMINCGEIEFCFGIQVICKRIMKIISLGQRNFIKEIFKCFGMEECRPINTPLDINFRFCKFDETIEESKEMEGVPYTEVIGYLMYVMIATWLDIATVIGIVSKFAKSPRLVH